MSKGLLQILEKDLYSKSYQYTGIIRDKDGKHCKIKYTETFWAPVRSAIPDLWEIDELVYMKGSELFRVIPDGDIDDSVLYMLELHFYEDHDIPGLDMDPLTLDQAEDL